MSALGTKCSRQTKATALCGVPALKNIEQRTKKVMPRLRRCAYSILLMFWTVLVACLIDVHAYAATKGGGGTTTSKAQECASAFQMCVAPCGGYPPQIRETCIATCTTNYSVCASTASSRKSGTQVKTGGIKPTDPRPKGKRPPDQPVNVGGAKVR
jgi:hypothetical protein